MSKSLLSLHKQLQTLICTSPLQQINHPLFDEKKVTVSVKRDDLLHPYISGNKWRKLKFNLIEARNQQKEHILSFGGAYSNHIHALAAAGFYFGFKTSAMIRGESHYATNPTLKQAQKWGMQLHFVTRNEYKQRHQTEYLQQLKFRFPGAFIVPEGGSNAQALIGVSEIYNELSLQSHKQIDHIVTATGSGGTLAGLISGATNHKAKMDTKITGIAVLKQAQYLLQSIDELLIQAGTDTNNICSWQLQTQFHCGGYAKTPPHLNAFCQQFETLTSIPVEPIYTGKMFYALFELIKQDYFKSGDNIVALHTGGLQGLQGLREQHKI